MAERCQGSVRCNIEELQEALSIHTRKITDSCRDKDCIEDLRVYLTSGSQAILDSAASVKVRCAELIHTYIDVEPVAFDRNHYCIDVTFFYRILADAVVGSCRPAAVHGVAVFSKRAVLCGEDSRAHIFTSETRIGEPDGASRYSANRPVAVVEVLDPMVLSSKVRDVCDCKEHCPVQIPQYVLGCFDEDLVLSGENRRLYVTLGQFSIIRLERSVQLVVPVVDYSLPTKECCDALGSCTEDPCEMFSRIPFPTAQFAPSGCDRECEEKTCCYTTTNK